jgi:hypothetical protein
MATILGTQTVNGVNVLHVSADPNTGGGTAALVGSIALVANGFGTYQKVGASSTSWVQLVLNGGNAPISDLGGGTFFFDARDKKQGSVDLTGGTAGVNVLSIFNIKAGDTYIFEVINTTGADILLVKDDALLYATIVETAYTTGSEDYVPTAIAGAKDRIMVTFNGTEVWVAPIGRNFV